MKHLAVLKKINLSVGQYAVFGSGPLAVRGIRPANDLDLIVKDELWRELNKKGLNCLSFPGRYGLGMIRK